MSRILLASIVTLGMVFPSAAVFAQAPYWDNSGSSSGSSYYTPPASQQQSNWGNQNQNNWGQPNNNSNWNNSNWNNSNSNWNNPNGGNSNWNNSGWGGGYGQQSNTLQGYVATAPVGTSLSVTNTTYISSDNSRIGDPVSVTLGYDLSMGGNLMLPAGTQIQGEVVSSVPAGRTARNGELQLRFNRAVLPDGRTYPLSARLVTPDGTGIIRGGTKHSRAGTAAKNTLGGAALGAASGAALGALVSGGRKWNEGLMWGSILGAGAGLGRTAVQQGVEAELQPGTPLQVMLDQPLTISN
jgi:hypothetical protein